MLKTITGRIRCFRAVFSAEGKPHGSAVMNGPGVRVSKRVTPSMSASVATPPSPRLPASWPARSGSRARSASTPRGPSAPRRRLLDKSRRAAPGRQARIRQQEGIASTYRQLDDEIAYGRRIRGVTKGLTVTLPRAHNRNYRFCPRAGPFRCRCCCR
jgi:hypothetical protein